MVKLAVGQGEAGFSPHVLVVILSPAFLKGDNVRRGIGCRKLPAYFYQSFAAEFRNVFETPAVESYDVDLGGENIHREAGLGEGGEGVREIEM